MGPLPPHPAHTHTCAHMNTCAQEMERAGGPETGHLNLERRLDSSLGSVCCDMSSSETCLPCNPHLQPSSRDPGLPTFFTPTTRPWMSAHWVGSSTRAGLGLKPGRAALSHLGQPLRTGQTNQILQNIREQSLPHSRTPEPFYTSARRTGEHPLPAAVFGRAITSSPGPGPCAKGP